MQENYWERCCLSFEHLRVSFLNCIHLLLSCLNYMHIVSYIHTYLLCNAHLFPLEIFFCACVHIYIYTHIHTRSFLIYLKDRDEKNGPVHFGFTWHARKISPLHPMNFLFISLSLPMENLSIRVNRQNGEHKKYKKNRQYLYSISLSLSNYRRWITDLDEPR